MVFQQVCKPSSVLGDHLSRPVITHGLKRANFSSSENPEIAEGAALASRKDLAVSSLVSLGTSPSLFEGSPYTALRRSGVPRFSPQNISVRTSCLTTAGRYPERSFRQRRKGMLGLSSLHINMKSDCPTCWNDLTLTFLHLLSNL